MAKRKRQVAAAAAAGDEPKPAKKTRGAEVTSARKGKAEQTEMVPVKKTKRRQEAAERKETTPVKKTKTQPETAERKEITLATKTKAPQEAAERKEITPPTKTKAPQEAAARTEPTPTSQPPTETIQIVAGSYDQVLHGITATIRPDTGGGDGEEEEEEERPAVEFADTFLFNAHASAIRCVAVSAASAAGPGQAQKVLLASGSTDERINVYSLSAHPPGPRRRAAAGPRTIAENRRNRELGTLLHHSSTVTALRFPTRSKLLSASEDSTVAVARTRDWAVLSTIRAPMAKAQGRPSGDTAAQGTAPSGVNDLAVHPSLKLMISVSRGERCMRLWNLVTGRKAGVLNFSRDLLREVGEARHATGEGRRVIWGCADGADEFAVGFDRDLVVFGMDSVPRCRVMPTPEGASAASRTKIHQACYVAVDDAAAGPTLLAVSTEDGRVLFFSTRAADLSDPERGEEAGKAPQQRLRLARLVAHVGGREAGVTGRVKDFAVVRGAGGALYLVAAGSEGKVRVWRIGAGELLRAGAEKRAKAVGRLLGTYETQNRITCMAAFLMIARPDGVEDSSDEEEDDDDEDEDEDEDEDDDDDDD
ncbi:hypothetical protein CDD83_8202 [Cordyceps sp. RAO-2017]|nr:hypothetical protein CDD83_8202 [Cordyceps sp. RAO-2017]